MKFNYFRWKLLKPSSVGVEDVDECDPQCILWQHFKGSGVPFKACQHLRCRCDVPFINLSKRSTSSLTSFSVNSIFLEHTMKPLVLALVDHRSTAWPWMATIKRLQLHVLFSPIEQKERKVTYKGVFGEYSYNVILLKKLQMEECLPYMGNIYFPHFVIIIIATATSSSPSTSPICHHHHCCCHQKKWYSLIVWCSLCTLVYGLLFFFGVLLY